MHMWQPRFVNALCFSAWHASHVLSVDEIAMRLLPHRGLRALSCVGHGAPLLD